MSSQTQKLGFIKKFIPSQLGPLLAICSKYFF